MGKRKEYDDDDGRVIANMNVDGMPYYNRARVPSDAEQEDAQSDHAGWPARQQEPTELSTREKLSFIFGALKAALLIALAFIGGLGIVIYLMTVFWK